MWAFAKCGSSFEYATTADNDPWPMLNQRFFLHLKQCRSMAFKIFNRCVSIHALTTDTEQACLKRAVLFFYTKAE
jgi:hypothetical protein